MKRTLALHAKGVFWRPRRLPGDGLDQGGRRGGAVGGGRHGAADDDEVGASLDGSSWGGHPRLVVGSRTGHPDAGNNGDQIWTELTSLVKVGRRADDATAMRFESIANAVAEDVAGRAGVTA